jgi:hypothetical protein
LLLPDVEEVCAISLGTGKARIGDAGLSVVAAILNLRAFSHLL